MKWLLIELLSPVAHEIGGSGASLLDPITREAMATCLSTLPVVTSDNRNIAQRRENLTTCDYLALFLRDVATPNPLFVEQLSTLLRITQQTANPR